MTPDTSELIKNILKSFNGTTYTKSNDIPDIELYMDQVTTFMESRLGKFKRKNEEKVLTKTMINNYAKNHLLPSPNKKKYSKEHIMLLIFIYYFKNILSINDIQTLLKPLNETYFSSKDGVTLQMIYDQLFSLEPQMMEELKHDVSEKFDASKKTFQKTKGDEQDYLQLLSFIAMLGFDVYLKKKLIEQLIDQLPLNPEESN